MEALPQLTLDCLQSLMASKVQMPLSAAVDDKPVVQMLASKRIGSGQIRCQFFDGINTCDKCVIKKSPQIDVLYDSNQLEKFTVLRLDQFWVSNAGDGDIDILVVTDVTPLMVGSKVGKRLEPMKEVELMDISAIQAPLDRAILEANYKNGFNPNYRPPQKNRKRRSSETAILPIDRSKVTSIATIDLNDSSFVIRGRVTTKSDIRTFTTRDGRVGRVFSFDMTDSSSEIRVTAFNAECDRFYDFIEKDLIYYISRGQVKPANRRYSNLKSDYEINLSHESAVEICIENVPLPQIEFQYVPIAQLHDKAVNTAVDVIGVITKVDSVRKGVSKYNQKEFNKREITLVDKTLHELKLSLWGKEAQEFNAGFGQVLAVKNAMIREFVGKTLSYITGTVLQVDPDVHEAHVLKGWFDRETAKGGLKHLIPLSKARDENSFNAFKYMSQMNGQTIPDGDTVYYSCKATIVATNRADRQLYKSCRRDGCNKKVKEENSFYFCDKCGLNSVEFEWTVMLGLRCADATGDLWVSAFRDTAEKLIGKTVEELSAIYDSDPNQYEALITDILFKTYVFKLGSKIEIYNNERRVKTTCYDIEAVEPINTSKRLIDGIRKLQI